MNIVDLRSDTVTLPTPEMRDAMYHAEVGDDVYREDPTMRRLEELAARMAGKEAALFATSGTQGNQVAIMTHTNKGDELLCESEAHVFYYEVGAIGCLSGVQTRTVAGDRGILTPGAVEQAIRGQDLHWPRTGLICLENTHNRAGGTCYHVRDIAAIKEVANRHRVTVHIDGARIFNDSVATGESVADMARHADSVNICLSKGLCAPVGSVLVGSAEFIDNARRYRKMLGGGMRQAGILAAAGIIALTKMVDRLAEDHTNAKQLALAIAEMGFGLDLARVETNIIVFDVAPAGCTAAAFTERLGREGVKASVFGETKVRMVTHYGIGRAELAYAIDALRRVLKG